MDEKKNVTHHFCVFLVIGVNVDGEMAVLVAEDSKGYRGVLSAYEKNMRSSTKYVDEKSCKKIADSIFQKHGFAIQGRKDWIVALPQKSVQDFADSSIETTYVPVVIPGKYSKELVLSQKGLEWMSVKKVRQVCCCDPTIWVILAKTAEDYKRQLMG